MDKANYSLNPRYDNHALGSRSLGSEQDLVSDLQAATEASWGNWLPAQGKTNHECMQATTVTIHYIHPYYYQLRILFFFFYLLLPLQHTSIAGSSRGLPSSRPSSIGRDHFTDWDLCCAKVYHAWNLTLCENPKP